MRYFVFMVTLGILLFIIAGCSQTNANANDTEFIRWCNSEGGEVKPVENAYVLQCVGIKPKENCK